jgi:DNA polymerase-3 subunit epsilon
MLDHLALDKPLAVLDLETTGLEPQKDRIVEVSVLKVLPESFSPVQGTGSGKRREHLTRRVNPGVPIPPAATAVHGITDGDVAGEPRFEQVAEELLAFLDGCDLCGFNLKRFDLRLLCAEMARAGRTFSLEGRAVVDPMEIFHRYEPRDLDAAVRFYLGRQHTGSHTAAGDVLATAEVLDAMVARYADLPRTVAGLHLHFIDRDRIDSDGFFIRAEGQVRFAKGKYRGQPLAVIAATKPDYLEWMLAQGLFEDTLTMVREALAVARKERTGGK